MTKIISNSFNVTPVYDGEKGDTGIGVRNVNTFFTASASAPTTPSGAPSGTGWADDGTSLITAANASLHLWESTCTEYSDGSYTWTTPLDDGLISDIAATSEEFALSDSGTTAPTTGWGASVTPTAGKWIWSRTKLTFKSGQPAYVNVQCIGYCGTDGKGITSADILFCLSTSQTTPPGNSSFTATSFADLNITSADANKYVWQCSKATYTTGNPTYSGKVCLGKVSDFASVVEQYALGTASAATGTWQDNTPPSPSKGSYLWTRTKLTYAGGGTTYSPSQAGMCLGYYGTDGAQGYGIVLTITRDNYTENEWATYAAIGHNEFFNYTGSVTVRVGDYFVVQGTSTDKALRHYATFRCTAQSSSGVSGTCISHVCDGAEGQRGNTGPMFYLCGQFPDMAPYSKDDYRCPVVYYGGEYWYLKADSASASDTPSASSTVWGKAEKFNMVFTDVLFVKNFAMLGSFVVNGDWMISQYGLYYEDSSSAGTPTSSTTYPTGYTAFHPIDVTYPGAAGYPAFKPYYAVDCKSGRIYALRGLIGGFEIGSDALGTSYSAGTTGGTYIKKDGYMRIYNQNNYVGLSVMGGFELLGNGIDYAVIDNRDNDSSKGRLYIRANKININTDWGTDTEIGGSSFKSSAGDNTFTNDINVGGKAIINGLLAPKGSVQTGSFSLPSNPAPEIGQMYFCKGLDNDLSITFNSPYKLLDGESVQEYSSPYNCGRKSHIIIYMGDNKWVIFYCG